MFGLSELAVILIVVIAVIAARKLPDLVRSAGTSSRILKAEARATADGDDPRPRIVPGETVPPAGTRAAGPDEGRGTPS